MAAALAAERGREPEHLGMVARAGQRGHRSEVLCQACRQQMLVQAALLGAGSLDPRLVKGLRARATSAEWEPIQPSRASTGARRVLPRGVMRYWTATGRVLSTVRQEVKRSVPALLDGSEDGRPGDHAGHADGWCYPR